MFIFHRPASIIFIFSIIRTLDCLIDFVRPCSVATTKSKEQELAGSLTGSSSHGISLGTAKVHVFLLGQQQICNVMTVLTSKKETMNLTVQILYYLSY